jgi:signal transduction histidine kinase
VSDRGGMGLVSMRERAERLGGSLTILSAPGEGTRVKISVAIDIDGDASGFSRPLMGSLDFPEVFQ